MSYKIVFFDIDGTLINEEKEIPLDTIDAIKALQQTGVEIVIATGRAPYFFKTLSAQLGIDSFISLNGAYVVFKGITLYKRHLSKASLELLVKLAADHNHSLVFQGSEAYYANAEQHPHILASVGSLKVDLPGFNPDFWKKADIYQAFLHCQAEEEHLYLDAFTDLRFVRWHQTAMDVLPKDGSKAIGIQVILQHLNMEPSEAVAFGDGLNDKEMLALVGLGIAMGNSNEELKPYADYVTTHINEGGIRKGLIHAGLLL
jgi:Cof subfamily protein (haloacid dehalogenase superfamily)